MLNDVLYVPDLGSNLFSVRAATNRGHDIKFNSDMCFIHKHGDMLAVGTLCGNLYKLHCTVAHEARIAGEKTNMSDLWHQRLGHVGNATLKKIAANELITGVKLSHEDNSFCHGCVEGKLARKYGDSVGEIRTTRRLELVHSDVWGPTDPPSFSGNRWFVTFTDDYTRCTRVYFMKYKSEVLQKFQEFEATAVGDSGERIGTLRTDNGGEYLFDEFAAYLISRQIRHQTSTPHCPDQNGVSERVNRTIVEKARAMLFHAGLDKRYWAESMQTAAYLKNRVPTRPLGDETTPYEKWYGRKPQGNTFRVFGCVAYAKIPDGQRRKMDPKAQKLRFVGYSMETKGYRLLDTNTGHIYVRRDVVFDESDFDQVPVAPSLPLPLPEPESVTLSEGDTCVADNRGQAAEPEREELLGRGQRRREPPVRFGIDEHIVAKTAVHYSHSAMVACTVEPSTLAQALSTPEAGDWKQAAESEIQSLIDNDTWELVDLPDGRKPVGCRWVIKN